MLRIEKVRLPIQSLITELQYLIVLAFLQYIILQKAI